MKLRVRSSHGCVSIQSTRMDADEAGHVGLCEALAQATISAPIKARNRAQCSLYCVETLSSIVDSPMRLLDSSRG